jgi:hypothetical protein
VTRTCLHCVLGRVLRAEARAIEATGLQIALRCSEATWLPAAGGPLYRSLRPFVKRAIRRAQKGTCIKITVVERPGNSHVEVIATIRSRRDWRVLGAAFPRFVTATLSGGFAEGVAES